MVKRKIGNADGIPTFPKKKYFGNKEPIFLKQRAWHLSLFLQDFLVHPLVKACPLIVDYFRSKACD